MFTDNFQKNTFSTVLQLLLQTLLILLCSNVFSQSATWTGANGTDWDDAGNWTFASGGSFTNTSTNYNVPPGMTGPTTASGSSLVIRSFNIRVGASATVPSGFTLDVNAKNQYVRNIINQGTFTIAAGGTVLAHNSLATDAFYHNSSAIATYVNGSLSIYDIGDGFGLDDGIYLESGLLEISGSLHISDIDTDPNDGTGIRAEFGPEIKIKANGTLTIENCPDCDDGILLLNSSTLNIEANGSLVINGVNEDGLQVDDNDGSVSNAGAIQISDVGRDGITVWGQLNNSGTITLDNVGDDCISNQNQVINSGTINCNDPAQAGYNAWGTFENSGSFFINSPGAEGIDLYIDSNNPNNADGIGDFTNTSTGTVIIDGSGSHAITGFSNTPFINQGILEVTQPGNRYLNVCSFNNSGTLRGQGYVDISNLTLQSTSVIEPKGYNNVPGNLYFSGAMNFSGVTISIDLEGAGNPGVLSDRVQVNGSVTYNSSTTINTTASANYPFFFTYEFPVVTYNSVSGTPTFNHDNCCAWAGIVNANQTIVKLTDLPEYVWTGAVDSDWNVASNWSLGIVPTAEKKVLIPNVNNQPVIFNGTADAVAKYVEVESGASLTIQSDQTLTIDGDNTGLYNKGQVNNNGMLLISNTVSFGIRNEGTFVNNTGGGITIDNVSVFYGISNTAGTFTNKGTIDIDNTTDRAIGCSSSAVFNNESIINIGLNGGANNINAEGLFVFSTSTFENKAGAQLNIRRTKSYGLRVRTNGAINNLGTIKIDDTENGAIFNESTVINDGGKIYIGTQGGANNINGIGINNASGRTITNKNGGEITVQNTLNQALDNNGTFNNQACSATSLFKHLTNAGTINNNGLFSINTAEASTSGNFINNGIVEDVQGTLPAVTNNEIEVAPTTTADCSSVSPAFDLGAAVDFNILGVFTDADATQSAGTYDVSTNTFTPTNILTQPTYIFYVKTDDPVGGCTHIVEWQVTNTGTPITCYLDSDGDGYGDPTMSQLFCVTCGTGYVLDNTDCDDGDEDEFPGQVWLSDYDNDGYSGGAVAIGCIRPNGFKLAGELISNAIDCDDNDPAVYLLQIWYLDADNDNYWEGTLSVMGCSRPNGFKLAGELVNTTDIDCDDNDENEFPGQTWYPDGDNDGYRGGATLFGCERPAGYKTAEELINTTDIDCNDGDPTVYMNQTWFEDADDDGYHSGNLLISCNRPPGFKLANELVNTTDIDCNDSDASVNPGAGNCDGLTISGTILWEHDGVSGVNNATVNVTGAGSGSATSDTNGDYEVFIPSGTGNFTVKPSKNINKLNGVTSADVTAIQQHVTNIAPLPAPYKRIAADVNKSNSISTFDATLVNQALLGNPTALNLITSWRFVPEDYEFPNPNVPWGFPEQINLTGVTGNTGSHDFKGIKLGDVVSTWANPANFGASEPLVFRIQDQILQTGQELDVEFRAGQLDDLNSFQFALYFDPVQLTLVEIEPLKGLPVSMDNFGSFNTAEGEIRMVWSQANPIMLSEDAPIFRLRFQALESGALLSDVLQLDEETLPAHAYNSAYVESDVQLRFAETSATAIPDEAILSLEAYPNPFSESTVLQFHLPETGEAEIRVYDTAGRVLFSKKEDYTAGENNERIEFGEAPSGMYLVELQSAAGRSVLPIIRVDK